MMGQPNPSPLHPSPPRWLRDDGDDDGSMLGLRLPLSLRMIDGLCGTQFLLLFLLLLPCPGPGLHPTHTLFPALSMLFCIFLFALHHQTLPESCVINLPIYISHIVYIHVLTVCCIYIIFSILVYHFVSCDLHSSVFGPHVLWLCVSLVLLKNSRLNLCAKHQRHIKAFPGIKISHEPRLTSIPPTIHPSQPSIHPFFLPASQLSISSLAFRINA